MPSLFTQKFMMMLLYQKLRKYCEYYHANLAELLQAKS